MIDLVPDILLLDERRLKLRFAGPFLSLLMPTVLVLLFVVWASFAIFQALTLSLADLQAALLVTAVLLGLALVSGAILMRRRPRNQPEHFLDALVSSLAGRRAEGDRSENDDLAAPILLVAKQLQRGDRKRS